MRLRGVLAGALVLVALEAVTRSSESADRVGGMLSGVAGLVRRALDPTVPAIPDLVGAGDPGTGGTGGASPAVYVPPTAAGLEPDQGDQVDDEPAPRLPPVASV